MKASHMTRMRTPPHPREVLTYTMLRKDSGLRVTEFARRLGISRGALSRVANWRAAVSAELAIRLAAALGVLPSGSSTCRWLTTCGTPKSAAGRRLSNCAR
jgi:addiction module HigA family antidote